MKGQRKMFCKYCGKEINDNASVCIHCGCATQKSTQEKNMGIAVLLWMLFGGFGLHRFYLGQSDKGIFVLLLGFLMLCFCWLIFPIFIWLIFLFVDLILMVKGN